MGYMDDVLRRLVLRQAAALEAGLQTESPDWVRTSMLQIEEAVRMHSFAFIASLPDESRGYLLRLKGLREVPTAGPEVP